VALAGRNRAWRYMSMESVKRDPAWMNGEYTTEPPSVRTTCMFTLLAGLAPLQAQKNDPTREKTEAYVDQALNTCEKRVDANDMIYYTDASRNYDPSKNLAKITVPVMWINSADDFVNPPELGIAQQQVKEMPHAKFVLLPITDDTRGHGTHTVARIWKVYLIELLKESEPKP
jgi:homoserine O-acetyltransferase